MFIHPQIDPIAISIGPLKVHWYGLMYFFGFLSMGTILSFLMIIAGLIILINLSKKNEI